jgi:ABC-2 type transport system ATP-binding protein
MPAIEVENLSRTFNSLRAVDNISFSVEAGEIFGFLGHNGAGNVSSQLWIYLAVLLGSTFIVFFAAAWALHRRN